MMIHPFLNQKKILKLYQTEGEKAECFVMPPDAADGDAGGLHDTFNDVPIFLDDIGFNSHKQGRIKEGCVITLFIPLVTLSRTSCDSATLWIS